MTTNTLLTIVSTILALNCIRMCFAGAEWSLENLRQGIEITVYKNDLQTQLFTFNLQTTVPTAIRGNRIYNGIAVNIEGLNEQLKTFNLTFKDVHYVLYYTLPKMEQILWIELVPTKYPVVLLFIDQDPNVEVRHQLKFITDPNKPIVDCLSLEDKYTPLNSDKDQYGAIAVVEDPLNPKFKFDSSTRVYSSDGNIEYAVFIREKGVSVNEAETLDNILLTILKPTGPPESGKPGTK